MPETTRIAPAYPHVLVVGGSGMLARLCVYLANSGRIVSVIGRNRNRLAKLAAQADGTHENIVGIAIDYRDSTLLKSSLQASSIEHGPIRQGICWMHEEIAPNGPMDIAEFVTGEFWHILSSASADPGQLETLNGWRERFRQIYPALDYRQIILGFAGEAGGSRWLTDLEISDGVIRAMRSNAELTVVGIIEPWALRP